MKTCSKCGIDKEPDDFHPDKSKKDGLVSHCKVCRKEYMRKWTKANSQYSRDRWVNDRQKLQARSDARHAVRDGVLIKQPCEVCGSIEVVKHHDDYSKPLDVRWLCRKHHDELREYNGTRETL